MLKKKLYQYFAKEFLKNFILILFSISMLMLLTQAARYLNLITEMGNSSITYLKYTILNYPKVLEKTIPIVFLINIFFTISKLRSYKELNIFWYSGLSEKQIVKVILKLTLYIFIIYYFLSIFFSSYSSSLARTILAESEFTLINSLVKEKNFNTPLKTLSIYVEENDKRGNLKKIFIHENNRVISAKKARVVKRNNKIFLELQNGITLEKDNKSFNSTTFEESIFDFSKFKTKNLKVAKFSERSLIWLIQELKLENSKEKDIMYEINKRLIKPFFIFFIAIFSSYILYIKNESKKTIKLNYVIFLISFLSIVFNEILLSFSSKNFYYSVYYFATILILCILFLPKHFTKKINLK